MNPDRALSLPAEIQLIRALAQRFRFEIQEEAARGFQRLHWLKADLAEFVLAWKPETPVTPEGVFFALLRRRMLNRYGVDVASTDAVSGWGAQSDWAAFEAAADEWVDKQVFMPVDVASSRSNARAGAEVKRLVENRLASLGEKIDRFSREVSMVTSDANSFHVHSYFSAGRSGFSYWQDILLPDATKASIRESYLSMFGISSQTELRSLSPADVEEAGAFVVEQVLKLVDHVRDVA